MTIEDVSSYYRRTKSIKATAAYYGISHNKCRKILITTGEYESQMSEQISLLLEKGYDVDDIADSLGKTQKYVNNYIPYTKGMYNSDDPTINAVRIRNCRKRRG